MCGWTTRTPKGQSANSANTLDCLERARLKHSIDVSFGYADVGLVGKREPLFPHQLLVGAVFFGVHRGNEASYCVRAWTKASCLATLQNLIAALVVALEAACDKAILTASVNNQQRVSTIYEVLPQLVAAPTTRRFAS
jgi:hypothetical protein